MAALNTLTKLKPLGLKYEAFAKKLQFLERPLEAGAKTELCENT